jgi:all-trans-retinol dehydrogenase (NAD+)
LNQELKLVYKTPGIVTTSVHPGWVRTPLLAPVEAELKKRGATLIEPEEVAELVVNQVLSASGGQVFVPDNAGRISLLRALPNWVQENLRGKASQTITESVDVGGM